MYNTFRISIYILKSAALAVTYLIVSYVMIFKSIANENLLTASLWNIVFIIFLITCDKFENYIWKKIWKKKENKENQTTLHKIRTAFSVDVPIKTSLYFFYIILLVCSVIVTAQPDFPILNNYSNYLKSAYNGLLVLMAIDKFLELVQKQISKPPTDQNTNPKPLQ